MRTRVATICALTLTAGLLVAGPLAPPPGAITPTYKTLGEIQPRTAIGASTTPGDADSMYRITAPGSYYLTGNILGVAGKSGIEIATNNVSIDLNGFAVLGSITSLNGITLSGSRDSIQIRNGAVTGWGGGGVYLGAGGRGHLVESITANGNHDWGIIAATGGIVRNCSASQNGANGQGGGVASGEGGLVESCTADANNGTGLAVSSGGALRNCTASNNTVQGINSGYTCTVTGCTLESNPRGIEVYLGSTVSDCRIFYSSIAAITADSGCEVRNNNCWQETPTPNSRGIYVNGSGAKVEGNTCSGFDVGFSTYGTHTIFTRNTAHNNTTNWSIGSTNACYVVSANMSASFSGNNGGLSLGSTDPNANFTY